MSFTMSTAKTNSREYIYPITIIGILFFTFGFITWVNGSLIQFLKIACELQGDVQAFLVTFAFYMAYFVLALPAAFVLKKIGYKNGMAAGLLIIAVGSVLFIPAANERSFGLFLTGLFIQGSGLALLQTASNPYITTIGPIESAARRISIMGICNKAAGIIAPLILSAVLLNSANMIETQIDSAASISERNVLLDMLAQRVIKPYLIISFALVLLAFLIKRSALPEITIDGDDKTEIAVNKKQANNVFQFRHLLLGVLCIFLYVGVEVMAGDAIGIYGREMGISIDETAYFTTFTLVAMLIGYVVGVFAIPQFISQQMALKYSAVLGIVLSIAIYFTTGYIAIIIIALLGLANALMWPAIFPLAISGLGRFTKTGSALLVMGIAGGAVIPLLYATLKQKSAGFSNEFAFLVCILPAYIYILYYAISGYKIKNKF